MTNHVVFGGQVDGGQFNPGHLTSVGPPDTQRERESPCSVGPSTLLTKSTFVPASLGKPGEQRYRLFNLIFTICLSIYS